MAANPFLSSSEVSVSQKPSPACLALALLLCAPLLGQDAQLGLARETPRTLQVNPPGGFLRLASAASAAPELRLGWDLWHPFANQALELGGGLRLGSGRQLTYSNSVGATGDVQARLKLDSQYALGVLYRFERPWNLPLEAGLGLDGRRERLVLADGALHSAGTLNRPWLRAVLRHRFGADGLGPFVVLEWARPLTSAPTPSGANYLLDLDHLGSSPNSGTAALAHAPTSSLALAVGYRFGRHARSVAATPAAIAPAAMPSLPPPTAPAVEVSRPQELFPVAPLQPVKSDVGTPFPRPQSPTASVAILACPSIIHFALNQSVITISELKPLTAWVVGIQASGPPLLTVTGHSDSTGTRAHNLRLSRARAQAVAKFLRAQGLTVNSIKALGPDQPAASSTTRSGRALNRRVEILCNSQSSAPVQK